MLLLLAAFYSLIQLALSSSLSYSSLNGGSLHPLNKDGNSSNAAKNITYFWINSNWTTFYFTNSGGHSFLDYSDQVTVVFFIYPQLGNNCIQVTDLYCAGDQFALYQEVQIYPQFLANSTTPGAVSCNYSSTDPNVTSQNSTWSSLSYNTFAIDYNILYFSVYATVSPFSAGKAAIRALSSGCPS